MATTIKFVLNFRFRTWNELSESQVS